MIDLHVHTTSSDGTLTPREVVRLAARKKIVALAVTDHDTVDGIRSAMDEGIIRGVEVIPGVELSVRSDYGILHILGYFVRPDHRELLETLERLKRRRDDRTVEILQKLKERGIDLPPEEVAKETGGGVTGRPHIARVMVARGLVSNVQEAFDRYLRKNASCYVPKDKLGSREAIALIRAAGGLAVMAHPYSMLDRGPKELEKTLIELVSQGLVGMEVFYPRHTKEQTKLFRTLAETYRLAQTGGTDFHGDTKPDIVLGIIPGRPPLPYEILDDLRRRLNELSSERALLTADRSPSAESAGCS